MHRYSHIYTQGNQNNSSLQKNSKWGQWLLHREPWKNQGAAGGITSWSHCFVCKALQLLQVRKHILTGHNWSIHKLISSSISKEQVEEKSKSHNKTYMRGKWNKITIMKRSEEDKRQTNRQREGMCLRDTDREGEASPTVKHLSTGRKLGLIQANMRKP